MPARAARVRNDLDARLRKVQLARLAAHLFIVEPGQQRGLRRQIEPAADPPLIPLALVAEFRELAGAERRRRKGRRKGCAVEEGRCHTLRLEKRFFALGEGPGQRDDSGIRSLLDFVLKVRYLFAVGGQRLFRPRLWESLSEG